MCIIIPFLLYCKNMDKATSAHFFGTHLVLLSVCAGAAFAGTLGPELRNVPAGRTVQVILQYSKASGGVGVEGALSRTARKIGEVPNGAVYNMTAGEAAAISANPSVLNVTYRVVF